MTIPVMFFSDYVCPWCFMAEASLETLQQTREVGVEYRAYELRPASAPQLSPEAEAEHRQRIAAGWPRVQEIARNRFGLDLKRTDNPSYRNTRLAHVGAKYAQAHGQGDAYHKAVFRAHWQDLRDISAVDTLAAIAGEVGLDEAGFRAALTDSEYIAAVEGDEYWAYQQGLQGVPAFIFGSRYLVSGAQPVDVLQEVYDRCVEEGLGV